MHIFTHLKPASVGKTGLGVCPDGMVEHDGQVGEFLRKLDQLGIANDTIVMYSTDNGAEVFSWPHGGTTPFRGQKNTNWESGSRVPCAIRWPGVIKPGTIINALGSHEDMLPTLLAAANEPGIVEKLKVGSKIGGRTYRVHLDGYNLLPALAGQTQEWPHQSFLYWSDDGDLIALRYQNWKLVFEEQRAVGFDVWAEPFVKLRVPLLINLRADPLERAPHESAYYRDFQIKRVCLLAPAQVYVGQWTQSFKEFPTRQRPASFSSCRRARPAPTRRCCYRPMCASALRAAALGISMLPAEWTTQLHHQEERRRHRERADQHRSDSSPVAGEKPEADEKDRQPEDGDREERRRNDAPHVLLDQ